MKRVIIFAISVLLIVCAASCSKKKSGGELEVKGGVAARIGDIKIGEREMQRRFDELSEQQKREFKGREGKAAFVDRLIEQKLMSQEAIAQRLDKTESVEWKLEELRENVLAGEYFEKNVRGKIKVTPEDIEEYYRSHEKEFLRAPVMRAQYLFSIDSLKAARWVRELRDGAKFNTLAKEQSEDKTLAAQNGDLGYFNPGGYIRSVGTSPAFSAAVEKLALGEVSGVIPFEKGYAVVKVTEKNPPQRQELADVTTLIEKRLLMQKTEDAYKAEIERLKQKYATANYVREEVAQSTRTPEELWEMAQLEDDARKRIEYYREIVNRYPTHKNAPQALFMIGFVYAEDLLDFTMATRTFEELERKYPESEMNKSAKWMQENMREQRPRFDSIEKMQKAMDEETGQTGAGKK